MLRTTSACLAFFALVVSAFAQAGIPTESRLRSIADQKLIRIAFRSDATPFSFLDAKNEPAGYTIDLCKLVVRSIEQQYGLGDLKLEWVPVSVHTRFAAIEENKADMECGSSTVTLGRMEQVDFSNFVFVETTAVVVRRDSNLRTFSEFNGKKIAVIAGTSNELALADQIRRRKLDSATLVAVKDREEGFKALESGNADGYASDKLLLVGAEKQHPEKLLLLRDELSIERYAIALPRGDWAFRLAVNKGLSQVYASGKINDVFGYWFNRIGLRLDGLLATAYVLGSLPD